MLVIGLCGGSGTGKTTAQAFFEECGIPGCDADVVYHSLIDHSTHLTRALAAHFGADILLPDGALDRVALSRLVFSGDAAGSARLDELNRLTHSAVLAECRLFLEAKRAEGAEAALINAPLLFESGFHRECDVTVAILAPHAARLGRLVARDGLTTEAAERRIAAQMDDATLMQKTDYQIHNDGDVAALREKITALSHHLLQLRRNTP